MAILVEWCLLEGHISAIQPVMRLGHSLDNIRENRENMVVPSQISVDCGRMICQKFNIKSGNNMEQHGKHVSFTSMIQIPMEYRHLMIFLKKLLLTTFHNAIPSISPSYFPSMYPIIIPWYTHIPRVCEIYNDIQYISTIHGFVRKQGTPEFSD